MTAAPSEASVWSPPDSVTQAAGPPGYICVTGNSGSGKSTIVRRLTSDLFPKDAAVGIDERSIHHPFLDRLFLDPESYSYELQLNFMLQRVLVAKRWLAAGLTVVMERSHLDDPVFIEHLYRQGLVNDEEKVTYLRLWHAIEARVPLPTAVVVLSVPPEVSIRRITADEEKGLRPREFGSDEQKRRWLMSWSELYDHRIHQLMRQPKHSGLIRVFDGEDSYEHIRQFVTDRIASL
jgi:deoxyadenosine/deoxycytidine kinase